MPQLTVEYTANLEFDVQDLLARLNTGLAATGAINLKGIKGRAIRLTEYRVADGNPDYAFVHVNLFIREGRPIEVQQTLSQIIMKELQVTFKARKENGFISLSTNIQEMRDGIALTDHNIPVVGKDS